MTILSTSLYIWCCHLKWVHGYYRYGLTYNSLDWWPCLWLWDRRISLCIKMYKLYLIYQLGTYHWDRDSWHYSYTWLRPEILGWDLRYLAETWDTMKYLAETWYTMGYLAETWDTMRYLAETWDTTWDTWDLRYCISHTCYLAHV